MRSLISDEKGITTQFSINSAKSNIVIPKQISWDKVLFLENWTVKNIILPKPIPPTTVKDIVELDDSSVQLTFEPMKPQTNARKSTSLIPTNLIFKGIIKEEGGISRLTYLEEKK